MIKSMTGYGHSTCSLAIGEFSITAQSVNRRFLEITLNLPARYQNLEEQIRQRIKKKINRGAVTISLTLNSSENSSFSFIPNTQLIKQKRHAWLLLLEQLNLPDDTASFYQFLMNSPDLFTTPEKNLDDEIETTAKILEAVDLALYNLDLMRLKEGEVLNDEFHLRFNQLTKLLAIIEEQAKDMTAIFRKRLEERISSLVEHIDISLQARLLQEIAIYAEKADITEEITRFNSHLKQGYILLQKTDHIGLGKTLEFLLQEMQREINTISSKADNLHIRHLAIEVKSELEKIREQIQNIE